MWTICLSEAYFFRSLIFLWIFLGIMEDGQHLIFIFWGLLGWSSLENFVLVDYLEFTMRAIIIWVG